MIISVIILLIGILVLLACLIRIYINNKNVNEMTLVCLNDISECLEMINKREWYRHINNLINYKQTLIEEEKFEDVPHFDKMINEEIREYEKRYNKNGNE